MTTNKSKIGGSNTDSIMEQGKAGVGYFCWDNSNKDETESMNIVEKEDGKEKWHQVETASKRKA
eukprot:13731541-Ditylum_brightwellii.AAC.1